MSRSAALVVKKCAPVLVLKKRNSGTRPAPSTAGA
jgi:hypothetical protein